MGHKAIQEFRHDHDLVLEQSTIIDSQLRSKRSRPALEKLAADILDFEATVLRPHLERENKSLLAVIRENLGNDVYVLQQTEKLLQDVKDDFLSLRQAVERGDDLRQAINQISDCLRNYAAYEQNALLGWAERKLDAKLLDDVDARLLGLQQPLELTNAPAGRRAGTQARPKSARPARPKRSGRAPSHK